MVEKEYSKVEIENSLPFCFEIADVFTEGYLSSGDLAFLLCHNSRIGKTVKKAKKALYETWVNEYNLDNSPTSPLRTIKIPQNEFSAIFTNVVVKNSKIISPIKKNGKTVYLFRPVEKTPKDKKRRNKGFNIKFESIYQTCFEITKKDTDGFLTVSDFEFLLVKNAREKESTPKVMREIHEAWKREYHLDSDTPKLGLRQMESHSFDTNCRNSLDALIRKGYLKKDDREILGSNKKQTHFFLNEQKNLQFEEDKKIQKFIDEQVFFKVNSHIIKDTLFFLDITEDTILTLDSISRRDDGMPNAKKISFHQGEVKKLLRDLKNIGDKILDQHDKYISLLLKIKVKITESMLSYILENEDSYMYTKTEREAALEYLNYLFYNVKGSFPFLWENIPIALPDKRDYMFSFRWIGECDVLEISQRITNKKVKKTRLSGKFSQYLYQIQKNICCFQKSYTIIRKSLTSEKDTLDHQLLLMINRLDPEIIGKLKIA